MVERGVQGPKFDLDGAFAKMYVAIERLDTAEEFAAP